MPTSTTYLGLTKPDTDQTDWGGLANTDLDIIDAAIGPQAPEVVTCASTIAFNGATSKSKTLTLTANVTTTTLASPVDGGEYTFLIRMGAGGFGFVFPSNFVNAQAISTVNGNNGATGVATQKWKYDAATTSCYPLSPLMS
jgi:hypothetical protein